MILYTKLYDIQFYEHKEILFQELKEQWLKNVVFLIDENFYSLWQSFLDWVQEYPCFIVPSGEIHKNLDTLQAIWKFFYGNEIDRQTLVICWGGGVVGDMGGFAAATYLRGLPYLQIPTTLLAMVDSSVGAKTAIDFLNTKNILGAFYPPKKVLICPEFLQTLPQRQILAGKAEMFKHAVIHTKKHLKEIQEINIKSIYNSVKIKRFFAQKDPYEINIRKALNFGHTIGHALEAYCLNNRIDILHGEAVFWGMYLEMLVFKHLELVNETVFLELVKKIQFYLSQIPINIHALPPSKWLFYLKQDKKKQSTEIVMPIISKLGKFELKKLSLSTIEQTLQSIIV